MPPMIGPVRGKKEEGVDGVITVAADVEATVSGGGGGGGGGPWGLGGGA